MYTHRCTLKDDAEELKRLPKYASLKDKFKRRHQLNILMSFNHPLARVYYRSYSGIRAARNQHIKSAYWIIHPFSSFRKHWELVMTIMLLIVLICTPLTVAFTRPFYTYLVILSNIFSLIDIGMRFYTGYTIDHLKTVILKPRMISMHYLKSLDFHLEYLSSMPLVFASSIMCGIDNKSSVAIYLNILITLKLLRLKSLLEYIGHVFEYYYIIDRWYVSHVKFFATFIVTLHWLGCYIIISGYFENLFSNYVTTCENWNLVRSIRRSEYTTDFDIYYIAIFTAGRYLFCISTNQRNFVNFRGVCQYVIASIIGYMFWCVALVLFVQTMFRINNADIRYESVMNQLNRYMRHKQLPLKMQEKLVDYYEFNLRNSYCREETVFTLLSRRLTREIELHAAAMMVKNISILKDLPDDVITNIIAKMKMEIYLPNDTIIAAGSETRSMYFIHTGTVGVFSPSGREICHLDDGSYFGEIGIITQDKISVAHIVALEITEVYRLDKQHFDEEIRAPLPELFKKMESVAERRRENAIVMEDIHRKQMLEMSMRVKLNKIQS